VVFSSLVHHKGSTQQPGSKALKVNVLGVVGCCYDLLIDSIGCRPKAIGLSVLFNGGVCALPCPALHHKSTGGFCSCVPQGGLEARHLSACPFPKLVFAVDNGIVSVVWLPSGVIVVQRCLFSWLGDGRGRPSTTTRVFPSQ
jgi:hypothetical protein